MGLQRRQAYGLACSPLHFPCLDGRGAGDGGGLVAQSCLALYDPMDCSPPGFSVHGIFQARMLERVAISFSRGSSWAPRKSKLQALMRPGLVPPGPQTWLPGWTRAPLDTRVPSSPANSYLLRESCAPSASASFPRL